MPFAQLNPIPRDLWAGVMRRRVRPEPASCDLAPLSFMAAWAQLGEMPVQLRVSAPDYDRAQRMCPGLEVVPDIAVDYDWELVGATRAIRSEDH